MQRGQMLARDRVLCRNPGERNTDKAMQDVEKSVEQISQKIEEDAEKG